MRATVSFADPSAYHSHSFCFRCTLDRNGRSILSAFSDWFRYNESLREPWQPLLEPRSCNSGSRCRILFDGVASRGDRARFGACYRGLRKLALSILAAILGLYFLFTLPRTR